jgi:putative FmdB family regulatory protein
MPFYDLKCSVCGEEFNTMAKMSEREQNQIKCPSCGSCQWKQSSRVLTLYSPKSQVPTSVPTFTNAGDAAVTKQPLITGLNILLYKY